MQKVTSKDGTIIAFDQSGEGPAVILVSGGLVSRSDNAPLASLLTPNFTVFNYDRRGRGESSDTAPYAIEREVEDIEALINAAEEPAFLYGISSGAALAMEATIKLGNKIKKLAIYEVPYNSDETARQAWKEYRRQLKELLEAGRKGDAVALFMRLNGMPSDNIQEMREHPVWQTLEAVASTLAYDAAILGEDASIPIERASKVNVPTLIINGGASYRFIHITAQALTESIPNAKHCTLKGQTHNVAAEALAPVLIEFFTN
jgi:pimeloyl-ACP methyl ester carboxylesterase